MHVLVIRLSAMGDVAMTVPVIYEVLEQNPNLEITVLSRPNFSCLFQFSNRLHFKAIDANGKHKGIFGLRKLFNEITQENNLTAVADLHNVLRSQIIGKFFSLAGVKTVKVDKGRKGKKALIQKENKQLVRQKHMALRYAEVFEKLNLKIDFKGYRLKKYLDFKNTPLKANKINIGFAPFAQHLGKAYPLEKMKEVIANISKNPDVNIYLFGGGKEESDLLQDIENSHGNIFSTAKDFTLPQQLAQMQKLQLMVSMDSANMHFASLLGVRVVSVWGATHIFAGFMGIGQSAKDAVEISSNKLNCRPCSVFGNKPCFREDYACMNEIKPMEIFDKIEEVLSDGKSTSRADANV